MSIPIRRSCERRSRPSGRSSPTSGLPKMRCAASSAPRPAPIPELMYIDFNTIASNQLVHNIGSNRYQCGGQVKLPCVIRSEGGVGRCLAATRSESRESWFIHTPGLYVVMPSTPYDAKGLLKSAIRNDNPVLFIEHKLLYNVSGPIPVDEYVIPLGVADIKKE